MGLPTINRGVGAGDNLGENAYSLSGKANRWLANAPFNTANASEAIAAQGLLLNIYSSGGAAKLRKANATDGTKPANAWADDAIANGADGNYWGPGSEIHGLSGLTPGADYYLDTTGGGLTATPPSGAGNLVQYVGYATTTTTLMFCPERGVTL